MTPERIAVSPGGLTLGWPDGEAMLPAALLRRRCRCADCRSVELKGAPVAVADEVALVAAQPVGAYALQLVFDDGHERGIYPWAWLRELAESASTLAEPG